MYNIAFLFLLHNIQPSFLKIQSKSDQIKCLLSNIFIVFIWSWKDGGIMLPAPIVLIYNTISSQHHKLLKKSIRVQNKGLIEKNLSEPVQSKLSKTYLNS